MASLQSPINRPPDGVKYVNWPNGKSTGLEMKLKYSSRTNNGREGETVQSRLKLNDDSTSSTSGTVNNDQNLPAEVEKTILCFCFMSIVFAGNLLFTAVIHDRTPHIKDNPNRRHPPLRDIGYDISAGIRGDYAFFFLTISEVILFVTTVSVVCMLVFHKHKSIVFRRMFFLLAMLFLVRLLTMNVTMLPVSSQTLYTCDRKQEFFSSGVITRRFVDMLSKCGLSSISGSIKYCGNYVYSGYTVVLVLNCLIVGEYCPSSMINLPMRTLTACSVLLILISGFDYTISVITAYYITTRLFWIYHTMANNLSLRELKETNINQLCKEWWYPIFQFLEGNVRTIVPPMNNTFQ